MRSSGGGSAASNAGCTTDFQPSGSAPQRPDGAMPASSRRESTFCQFRSRSPTPSMNESLRSEMLNSVRSGR